MDYKYLIALLMNLALPVICGAQDNRHFEKLPWPPNLEQRRHIGEEIRVALKRSDIPESKELLQILPSAVDDDYGKLVTGTRLYFGGWKLDDDGITLWTARIRNELIRHQYVIRFTLQDGRLIASDLGVITTHAMPRGK